MSKRCTLTGSLAYEDNTSGRADLAVSGLLATIDVESYRRGKQLISSPGAEVDFGGLDPSGGWAMFVNRDATNPITLYSQDGGVLFARLEAGEFCLLRLGPSMSGLFAEAPTDDCWLEYLAVSA